jgi:peptidoglycan/LPS O-acetylase OafA/YrhL
LGKDVDAWATIGGVAAGVAYVSNFVIAFAGADALPAGVSHLWSLAQEEQFYLVWPPVLFIVCGGRRRWAGVVAAGALTFVSIQQWRLLVEAPGHRLDWAPDTRSGGILIGCLAGLAFTSQAREALCRIAKWLFPLALPLFALLIFMNLGRDLYRGPLTLFGVCAALLMIRAVDPRSPLRRVLASPPLVFLGRISYSLYLWHLPVLAALGVDTNDVFAHGSVDRKVLGVAAAIALATASYYVVELPFLRRKRRIARRDSPPAMVPATAPA